MYYTVHGSFFSERLFFSSFEQGARLKARDVWMEFIEEGADSHSMLTSGRQAAHGAQPWG